MNKKGLSVVMAGAMLATSVAPVLAAPVEYGVSQKKLVEKEINDLVESKKISTNKTLQGADFVAKDVADIMKKSETEAESAYGVKVLKDGKEINLNEIDSSLPTDKLTYNIANIKTILASENLVADMTIQIVERENSEFLGQVIPGSQIVGNGVSEANKFTADAFASVATFKSELHANIKTEAFIKSIEVDAKAGTAKVTLKAVKDMTAAKQENITLDFKAGDEKLNFNLPLNAEDKLVTDTKKEQDCVKFAKKETYAKSQLTKADPELVKEYKLVDDSAKHEEITYLAKDLYDGLALTAKGTEIQSDLKNAEEVAKENNRPDKVTVQLSAKPEEKDVVNGIASFTVTYYASHKDVESGVSAAKKVVTVKSTNLKELQSLYDMLTNGNYTVGIVAGANRYETAVNVAKAQGLSNVKTLTDGANNIVLVNGNSLVDGLAAAPLAAKLSLDGKEGTAVLLSKTDSLPKETKEYLEELTSEIPTAKRKFVTINLVGGESVLSESLVNELKEMGFKVERFGGENREETSLEVAEALKVNANKEVFVVGANGEADAMSIAAVAASKKAPIIVSSVHGLTKDAVKYIKNNYSDAADNKVAVIGGEAAVSKEDYDKIDAVTEETVARIAGKNRFETNAAIIKEYATTGMTDVVLVKDGVSNKEELVDALSAANFAVKYAAPIVLATDKITDAQKVELLNKKAKDMSRLTQVGQGVARTTLESVAEFLGLSNIK